MDYEPDYAPSGGQSIPGWLNKRGWAVQDGRSLERGILDVRNDKHAKTDCTKPPMFAFTLAAMHYGKYPANIYDRSIFEDLPTDDQNDWAPGDWGYLDNLNGPVDAGQGGQNMVYTGNEGFFAHPYNRIPRGKV